MHFSPARKTLLRRLADGRFHSGASLARELGLSRTAVWSLAHELETLGLKLDTVPGKGYRLARSLELLDENAIAAALSDSARALLAELEIHDELDSTNTRLMQRGAQGAAAGTVCLAERQTAGRGRLGREWRSPFGGNVFLSLLWRFEEHAAVAGLSLAAGVAVARALERVGVRDAGLKWPNDILWRDGKLGGILLEIAGEAHGGCAVVIGIGLNLFIPETEGARIEQAWTDLERVTDGAPPSRNRLVGLLLDELLTALADYGQHGLRAYLDEWRARHCYQGRRVTLHIGDAAIRGVTAGVNDEGLLVLDCEEGGRRAFASGDVRLRLDE
jgi:BirA family biotin operon repressor/biotin-[acetyl-CoA-carboxylase] ligase